MADSLRRAMMARAIPGFPLFPVPVEEVHQVFLREFVNQVEGRLSPPPVHAHVQGPPLGKTESPAGVLQLAGGHAEVEEDSVHLPIPRSLSTVSISAKSPGRERPSRGRSGDRFSDSPRASSSRSMPISRASGALSSRILRAWPPPPTVPST